MKPTAMKADQPTIEEFYKQWCKDTKRGGVEYIDCALDFDYTICDTLREVQRCLRMVDTDFDDEFRKSKVIISGIGLTHDQYKKYKNKEFELKKLPSESYAASQLDESSTSNEGEMIELIEWLEYNAKMDLQPGWIYKG